MVVILGAGITGAAAAYYLSQAGVSPITVIDAVGPATCSKAAAFLSESWGDGTKTEKLHRKSFQLHLNLADELCLESFRQVPAFHKVDLEDDEEEMWFSNEKPGRHALVDPQEIVLSLMNRAQEGGAMLEIQSLAGFEMDESRVTGIHMEDGSINKVSKDEPIVACLGPWTSRLEDWINTPVPIDGVLSTSLVWNDLPLWESPRALFCEEDANGCHLEIFQRNDQSLYVSGLGNSKPLKASLFRSQSRPLPGKEIPSQPKSARRSLQAIPSINRPADDVRACIRPQSPDGIPIVGKVGGKSKSNLFVASGGGQWGITWGPLLGLMVANMICDKDSPISPVSSFSPSRFDTLVHRSLMERRSSKALS